MNKGSFVRVLHWFVVVLFGVSFAISIFYKDWIYAFVSFVMFLLAACPDRFRSKRISFSAWLNLVILLFVYMAIFLGEFNNFYFRFWWWDILLHSFSAVILGLFGFGIVYFLNKKASDSRLSPLFVAIFGFSFAVMIGAVWEIFEFFMDFFFGLNMQKTGIVDTMADLIVNVIGAAVASSWGYLSLKVRSKETSSFFRDMIDRK